jgi:hypothetical protein
MQNLLNVVVHEYRCIERWVALGLGGTRLQKLRSNKHAQKRSQERKHIRTLLEPRNGKVTYIMASVNRCQASAGCSSSIASCR